MSGLPGDERPDFEPRQYAPLDPGDPAPQRPLRRPSLLRTAPVSMAIMAVCFLVYVVFNQLQPDLLLTLTFSPANGLLFPGLISHMFAHGNLGHLLMNMIVLFFLGVIIEARYGHANYALLYFASGLVAAFAQAVVAPAGFLLGASGALAGVMGAFVRHYPKERLYLYGILPMPAWLLLTGWLLFNIYGASQGGQGIAFVAHIAGFVAGLLLSIAIEPPGRRRRRRPPWPASGR